MNLAVTPTILRTGQDLFGLGGAASRGSKRYRMKPSRLGGVVPSINLDKALALADAIEDQVLADKKQLRK